MEVISVVASGLNLAFLSLGNVVQHILHINYYILTEVTYIIQGMIGYFANLFQITQDGAQCAMFDFVSFVIELTHEVSDCVSFLYGILFLLVMWAYNFFYLVILLVWLCYSLVVNIYNAVIYATAMLFNAVVYITKLLFSAILLLLTFLPNAFVVIGIGIITYGNFVASYIKLCADTAVSSIKQTISVLIDSSINKVQNIPLEAYIGLLMILVAFYIHKAIIRAMERLACNIHYSLIMALNTSMRVTRLMLCKMKNFVTVLWQFFYRRQFGQPQPQEVDEYESSEEEEHSEEEEDYTYVNNNTRNRYFLRQRPTNKGHCSGTFKFESESSDEECDLSGLKKQLEKERDMGLCIICQDKRRNEILLPCRHFSMCNICCDTILKSTRECPICRSYIYEALQVYM